MSQRFSNRDDWFMLGLLALSLGLNVHLAWKVARKPALPRPAISVGDKLPNLLVDAPTGGSATIEWAASRRPTLVYYFSPDCHWCTRNLENIKLLSNTLGSGYRVIWLAPSNVGIEKYIKANNLPVAVYTNAHETSGRKLDLSGTPQTLIISTEGVVSEVWHGAYGGKLQADIESKLHVKLPGLSPSTGE